MQMVNISDILQVMYETALTVSKRVELQERPSSTDTSSADFIVVELPSAISDMEEAQDGGYGYYNTTGQFTVFVKDKKSAKNPNAISVKTLSRIVSELMGKFPVKDEKRSVKLRRPRVLIPGQSDERGYHYSVIQCDITTLV